MKFWRTLRSFVFFCSFWRTDFPKFWNYCFIHWGTNSLWRTERVLYFTISRTQHEACSCTFSFHMVRWICDYPFIIGKMQFAPEKHSLNTSISIQLKSTWKKSCSFFPVKITQQSKMNLLWRSLALFPKNSQLHAAALLYLWWYAADRLNSFIAVNYTITNCIETVISCRLCSDIIWPAAKAGTGINFLFIFF